MLKLRRVRTLSDVFAVPVPSRHLVCIGPMQDRTREGLVGTRLLPNSGVVHGSLHNVPGHGSRAGKADIQKRNPCDTTVGSVNNEANQM